MKKKSEIEIARTEKFAVNSAINRINVNTQEEAQFFFSVH